jgi:hypothetical protein
MKTAIGTLCTIKERRFLINNQRLMKTAIETLSSLKQLSSWLNNQGLL